MPWILSRIQQKEAPVSQNKQYSAEILAILLQSSSKNREKFIGLDGADIILQLLSQYRKRDPEKDSDEEEYAENLFDSLICLVDEDSGKDKFIEAEGIELAQIMLREGRFSKPRALRVLDHAFGGAGGGPACERLIEAAGLRTVFGMFMKKVRSNRRAQDRPYSHPTARKPEHRASARYLCFASSTSTRWLRSAYPNTSQIYGERLRENREAHQASTRICCSGSTS